MKKFKLIIYICALIVSISYLFMSACGDDEKSNKNDPIEFDTYSVELYVGEQYAITVKGANDNTIIWSTEDENIANVSDGVITAVGAGTTNVIAKISEETIICKVSVTETLKAAVNFSLNKEVSNVYIGYSKELSPRLIRGSENLDPKEYSLTYSSSDATVVSVSDAGVIVAQKSGKATITASVIVYGKTYVSDIEINVTNLGRIELSEDNISLSTNGDNSTYRLNAEYYETDDNGEVVKRPSDFIWTSSDTSVLTVYNGEITAKKPGKAVVYVSNDYSETSCDVTVYSSYNVIYTAYDFINISNNMEGYYELANDIDFDGIEFNPIGYIGINASDANILNYTPFNGTLNGNGYTVKNITHLSTDCRSIFTGLGSLGKIYNVCFENVYLPYSRAARSSGLVWKNEGTINNVKISVITNGTGVGVNEWGFAGISSQNYGIIKNCFIQLTDNSTSQYTGAIIDVNRDGKIINNVAVVNKNSITSYIHTGSYGNLWNVNNTVCTDMDSAIQAVSRSDFSSNIWEKSNSEYPTLKKGDRNFEIKNFDRMLSDTSDIIVENLASCQQLFYYNNGIVDIPYTLTSGSVSIANENLSFLKMGNNDIYLKNDEGVIQIRIRFVTAIFGTTTTKAAFVSALKNNIDGYFLLNGNVTLGNMSGSDILSSDYAFSGNIDGQGYTLNYSFGQATDRYLFDTISDSGVIENIHFIVEETKASTSRISRYAAIARENNGLIENCYIEMTYQNCGNTGANASAGAVMYNNGTINRCIVKVAYTNANEQNCSGAIYAICLTNTGRLTNVATFTESQNGTISARQSNAGSIVNWCFDTDATKLTLNNIDSFISKGFAVNDNSPWTFDKTVLTFNGTTIQLANS